MSNVPDVFTVLVLHGVCHQDLILIFLLVLPFKVHPERIGLHCNWKEMWAAPVVYLVPPLSLKLFALVFTHRTRVWLVIVKQQTSMKVELLRWLKCRNAMTVLHILLYWFPWQAPFPVDCLLWSHRTLTFRQPRLTCISVLSALWWSKLTLGNSYGSAEVSMGVYGSFWCNASIPFRYTHSNGINLSEGTSIFSFWWDFLSWFPYCPS